MAQECSECSLCTHIYVLPPPNSSNGVESLGVCKLCGMEKTHLNSGNERYGGWVNQGTWNRKPSIWRESESEVDWNSLR